MRTFIRIFSLAFFIFSCSKDGETNKKIDIDPLNEFGLIEFKLFSNPSTGIDKVIEGSDGTFNYFGYGESTYANNGGINIPKNIKTVVQFDPQSNMSTTIEIDNYFIPIRFKRESNLSELDTIFTVQYNSERTDVTIETVDSNGNSTYLDTVILSGIDVSDSGKSSIQTKGSQNQDCDDMFEEAESTFVCGENSIVKTTGADWEKYTGFGGPVIRTTGKFMSWIYEVSDKHLCKSDKGSFKMSAQKSTQNWTCEDYTMPVNGYVKFLDTGDIFEFPGVLVKHTLGSNQNCGGLKRAYTINMSLECQGSQGFIINATHDDYMSVIVSDGYITSSFILEDSFVMDIPTQIEDRMFSLLESEVGIHLMAKMVVWDNYGRGPDTDTPRPIEAVFRY